MPARLGVPRPDELTAAEWATLNKAGVRIDPDSGALVVEFSGDLNDREHGALLKIFNKIKHQQTTPPRGEFLIHHAHRPTNDPDYPGLGFSFDKIACIPDVDRRVPIAVRSYIQKHRSTRASGKQLAKKAHDKVEAYRRRVDPWFFRWVAAMMTDLAASRKR